MGICGLMLPYKDDSVLLVWPGRLHFEFLNRHVADGTLMLKVGIHYQAHEESAIVEETSPIKLLVFTQVTQENK